MCRGGGYWWDVGCGCKIGGERKSSQFSSVFDPSCDTIEQFGKVVADDCLPTIVVAALSELPFGQARIEDTFSRLNRQANSVG